MVRSPVRLPRASAALLYILIAGLPCGAQGRLVRGLSLAEAEQAIKDMNARGEAPVAFEAVVKPGVGPSLDLCVQAGAASARLEAAESLSALKKVLGHGGLLLDFEIAEPSGRPLYLCLMAHDTMPPARSLCYSLRGPLDAKTLISKTARAGESIIDAEALPGDKKGRFIAVCSKDGGRGGSAEASSILAYPGDKAISALPNADYGSAWASSTILRTARSSAGSIMLSGPPGSGIMVRGLPASMADEFLKLPGALIREWEDGGAGSMDAVLSTPSLPQAAAVWLRARLAQDGRIGMALADVRTGEGWYYGENDIFEPASAVKLVHSVRLLEDLRDGLVGLEDDFPYFAMDPSLDWASTADRDEREFACPVRENPQTVPFLKAVWMMMENSDNRITLAVSDKYGMEALNATAASLGMGSTLIAHRIGCLGMVEGEPGLDLAPGRSSIMDLLALFRAVEAGRLGRGITESVFYSSMKNDLPPELEAEGVSPGSARIAYKTGKYVTSLKSLQCMTGVFTPPAPMPMTARALAGEAVEAPLSPSARKLFFCIYIDDARDFPDPGSRETLFSLRLLADLLRPELR